MGFFDSFSTGVGSFFSGVGSLVESFAGTTLGGQFLGQLGEFGLGELGGLIGLTPSSAGAPTGFGQGYTISPIGQLPGAPLGPLGTPVPGLPVTGGIPSPGLMANTRNLAELQQVFNATAGMGQEVRQRAYEELAFLFPSLIGWLMLPAGVGPGFGAKKPFAAPPPSIPASQPFGQMPGTGSMFGFPPIPPFSTTPGGPQVPAFPTTVQASFPPIVNALFGGGGGVQPAAFGGAVAKQLPGLLGGLGIGELFGALTNGGGGTPMFRPTMAGARAQFFRTQNPATGQDTWFRPAGRPLLWSGDLTACKRVNKVARRACRKR